MYCKLFSTSSRGFCKGFGGWKKALEKINSHEQSSLHAESLLIYISRITSNVKKIDDCLRQEQEHQESYWRSILQRILSVTRFLASRGLPFRGTNEKFGSKNNGNYLGILELLAEYDPVLEEHIKKYASQGSGSVSYLSQETCCEFLHLMAKFVLNEIGNTSNSFLKILFNFS